jgi:transposase-like protein
MNASEIAVACGASRQAINSLLAGLRGRIVLLTEKESCFAVGEVDIDESYFGGQGVPGKRGQPDPPSESRVFGMKQCKGMVYSQVVKNCSAGRLAAFLKNSWVDDGAEPSVEWMTYDEVVDARHWHRHKVRHLETPSNDGAHRNGMDNFLDLLKARLVSQRGIRADSFSMHLKEAEFKFNHCQDDLYSLILRELRRSPLYLSVNANND